MAKLLRKIFIIPILLISSFTFIKCVNAETNLFDIGTGTTTGNGVDISYTNNEITFDGTTTGNGSVLTRTSLGTFDAGTYIFSFERISGSTSNNKGNAIYIRYSSDDSILLETTITQLSYTQEFILESESEILIQVYVAGGGGMNFNDLSIDFSLIKYIPPLPPQENLDKVYVPNYQVGQCVEIIDKDTIRVFVNENDNIYTDYYINSHYLSRQGQVDLSYVKNCSTLEFTSIGYYRNDFPQILFIIGSLSLFSICFIYILFKRFRKR